MEKRYQVFISSTYTDLQAERAKVFQTLMEMDCIPSGMELFPAADEEQWEFIKRVIEDCDYYLLIIGGRYGSLTPDGISYTEMEYDYAVSRGLKVIALIHGSPENLPVSKSEVSPEKAERLSSFRGKVASGRLVKFWQTPEELPGLVALSVSKTIKAYPAIGWVRGSQVGSAELLAELNQLRKRNEDLERELASREASRGSNSLEGLVSLDTSIDVTGSYLVQPSGSREHVTRRWAATVTWRDVFGLIAPHLLHPVLDASVQSLLASALFSRLNLHGESPSLDDGVFQTIKVQLMAHQFVAFSHDKSPRGVARLSWELSDRGREVMLAIRTIRAESGGGQ